MSDFKHGEVTEAIIGAAFEVHNTLGYGYLEKVYQRAMQVELLRRGCECQLEEQLIVRYKSVVVGEYRADLIVDKRVMVELKASRQYNSSDEAQLINQLKATRFSVGLLINFGREKVEFKRVVV